MSNAWTLECLSPQLRKVAERAQREPNGRFHARAHRIEVPALVRAYHRLRPEAAAGVDGITKEGYGQNLWDNLQGLHERWKSQRWRQQPIRRVHIPKDNGPTRPLGISGFEDKIVQDAVRELLQAIYEQDFQDCSYGFRPQRSAHDAIRAVQRAADQGVLNWVLEADIVSFFDSLDRQQLSEMLQERVADGSLLRLIRKCLQVGVLAGAEITTPDAGTAQGSVLSPLLGNVYRHAVLDRWLEREVRPRLQGRACLIRYADDFVIGFEHREDAERVRAVLGKRMQRYGLNRHPDKTRLVPFQPPERDQRRGKGPATFDFLGLTLYWRRTRTGRWRLGCKTRCARLGRAIRAVYDWCRRHRHQAVAEQHAALVRRLQGHFNYFGVNGNQRSLKCLAHQAKRAGYQWLRRRSQRVRLTWERFRNLVRAFPLPSPRVVVAIWG